MSGGEQSWLFFWVFFAILGVLQNQELQFAVVLPHWTPPFLDQSDFYLLIYFVYWKPVGLSALNFYSCFIWVF